MRRQQLSRMLRTEGMTRIAPIDSVEHVGQLRGGDSDYAVRRRWPDEAAFLQPFGIERHAETVMPDDLDQIATRASEDKEIACMGIALQCLLDLQSQAIHASPHVRSSDRKPDPHTRGNRDHRRSSTSSTRRSARASTPLPTQTRYLPQRSISIVAGPVVGCVAAASGPAVTTTGINCGADRTAGARGSSR